MKTLIFKTQFLYDKKIQREIEVPASFSLYSLARAIIKAYDFDFDHAFGFFRNTTDPWRSKSTEKYELFADMEDQGIEPVSSGSVKKTKVSKVWQNPKEQMLFLFDYGDNWRWIVTLKAFGKKQAGVKYPRILSKKGEPPVQYPDYDDDYDE